VPTLQRPPARKAAMPPQKPSYGSGGNLELFAFSGRICGRVARGIHDSPGQ
jgi:hypothetical protein